MRGVGHRLGRRRRDGANEVHLRTDEALGDVLEVRLVGLCILAVNRDVLALFEAAFLEAIDKALVGGVERIVLDELDDADLVVLAAARRSRLIARAAAGHEPEAQHSGGTEGQEFAALGYIG